MKIRRKTQQCLNCGLTLNTVYHYCPRCGQENNDNNVSFGTFVREFFANYFSFDSKFAKSTIPFLAKPGFLTNRFNEGKRASYVHPLRLYLIVSIVFFFLATMLVRSSLGEVSMGDASASENNTEADSAQIVTGFRKVVDILENETLNDQEALDSLQSLNTFDIDSTALSMRAFHQIRRVAQNDLDVFAGFVLQNMPLMMFLLIPLFALLLRLFYIRRKQHLYVQHLTHALHLHAFLLLSLGSLVLIRLLFSIDEAIMGWIEFVMVITLTIYILLSFRKVYQQSWLKTTTKLFFIGIVYLWVLLIFGMSEAIISFMLF